MNIPRLFKQAGKVRESQIVSLGAIDFAKANLAETNLAGVNLVGANLKKAILRGANLEGADLAKCILHEANLNHASLQKAVLEETQLEGASMAYSKLEKANLHLADLTNSNLFHASLQNACVNGAKLNGAELIGCNLIGATFYRSRLDQACLFSESMHRPVDDVCGGLSTIGSIADMLRVCQKVKRQHAGNDLYFRGECTDRWELRSSVMRVADSGNMPYRNAESAMLRDLISRRPDEFTNALSALAQWVLGQHHGLNTRLLDITRNPLVALFYACGSETETDRSQCCGKLHIFSVPRELVKPFNSDAISVAANFAKLSRADQSTLLGQEPSGEKAPPVSAQYAYKTAMGRLIQLIRSEKPYFEDRIDPKDFFRVFVVEPQRHFERLRVQSGAFLLSVFHKSFEQDQVLKSVSNTPLYCHYTLSVKSEVKQKIREELSLVNITRESLFPGLDSAAQAVTKFHADGPGSQE